MVNPSTKCEIPPTVHDMTISTRPPWSRTTYHVTFDHDEQPFGNLERPWFVYLLHNLYGFPVTHAI